MTAARLVLVAAALAALAACQSDKPEQYSGPAEPGSYAWQQQQKHSTTVDDRNERIYEQEQQNGN